MDPFSDESAGERPFFGGQANELVLLYHPIVKIVLPITKFVLN